MSSQSLRVLLVDDSEDDRVWVKRLLREMSPPAAQIHESASVAEALEILAQHHVDIVIADFHLPDGSGVDVASHPRILAAQLPVIVVTGAEQPDQGTTVLQQGAADFLPKDDITPRSLARACAHACTRARLEREVTALRGAERAATSRERTARIEAEIALEKERQTRARVTGLHVLSSKLLASGSTAGLASLAMDHIERFEKATAVSVYMIEGDQLILQDTAGYLPAELAGWTAIPLSAAAPVAVAVREKRVVRVADDSAMRAHGIDLPARAASWLCVPLSLNEQPLGVLGIRLEDAALPSDEGTAYIELIAQHMAQAFHRETLYQAARAAAAFEERLLAVVGHDLRTPIAAILAVAQMLKLRPADGSLIGRLERSGRWMADLITHVLDRAAARRGSLERRAVALKSVASVLRDRIEELRAAFPESDLRLTVQGTVDSLCDPVRTSQIVSNLVRNAIQHGDRTAPVSVDLAQSDAGVTIRVHNLGTPISSDELPVLFDPFRRGRSAGGMGTGLGLFIVRETVTALQGEVRATSDHAGTVLEVMLPHAVPVHAPASAHESSP